MLIALGSGITSLVAHSIYFFDWGIGASIVRFFNGLTAEAFLYRVGFPAQS